MVTGLSMRLTRHLRSSLPVMVPIHPLGPLLLTLGQAAICPAAKAMIFLFPVMATRLSVRVPVTMSSLWEMARIA
jgi:hypothetical protein